MLKDFSHYLTLCKPKVVTLMMITAMVGMLLAAPPWQMAPVTLFLASLGIALSASAGAVCNQLLERHLDQKMRRTQHRPLAQGTLSPTQALVFAIFLGITGLGLVWQISPLTAWLSFASLIGYAFVYTSFLKKRTPQNIVIGGITGATPPLLGWTAVTQQLDPFGWLLALLIFIWTPPHFWALAIHRYQDYAAATWPMLPITHGIPVTALCILLYSILLFLVSLLPYLTGMSGFFYLLCSVGLSIGFVYHAIQLYRTHSPIWAWRTFQYSTRYLACLFLSLLIDHYCCLPVL